MRFLENESLKPYNTFGLDVKARHFVEIESEKELVHFLLNHEWAKKPLLPLGGGSNILLTKDFEGTVIKLSLNGKRIIKEDNDFVKVAISAGENWHEFVLWAIRQNFGGVENLSLIPGNIGTAPIQNIGAYGVELKDVFVSLSAVEIESGQVHYFTHEACEFGYRDSVFKRANKGKFIITEVTLQLTKQNHQLKMSYGAIQDQLKVDSVSEPTIQDISNAVIAIRQSKLPDPKEIGNSGSFFKNPVISNGQFAELKSKFPDVASYPNGQDHTKVAAGWLIEKAGFKGLKRGAIGVHEKQALVLVNYGGGEGKELKALSSEIQEKVKEIFGISLEAEVNIL
ncbi:MAG: UDP-N-acetylmuramate dehydrogenase [Schleiferiaceae bacterium]|jgi:UDP-N-acetylmuramate dehydrogenase|nr:UDP-N-acetylmuramate dehydrogenase [Schleiferiaceae bacterium]